MHGLVLGTARLSLTVMLLASYWLATAATVTVRALSYTKMLDFPGFSSALQTR